jgi:phospholipase C
VCSQPFDHTSILRFVEVLTGVHEPNITEWRRKTFGDLTAAFRFDSARATPPTLPDTAGPLTLAEEHSRLPLPQAPRSDQAIPLQEKGTRNHIPAS